MDPEFALDLSLPEAGSRQLLRELHGQLRRAILDGRLRPGLRMPSTRAFAERYAVSRNTAVATYDLLLSEGYLVTRERGGTFVADALPQPQVRSEAAADARHLRLLHPFWREPPAIEAHVPEGGPPRYDFRLGSPSEHALRYDVWHRLSGRATRALARGPQVYAEAAGRPALRAAIASHAAYTRAVACRPEDVVVTAGTQQALDLLARILVTPGRTVVAMEDPGYPPARAAFHAAGAQLAPVPVDEEGMLVERLPQDAKIIYVTPSHQFPLGCVMSMRRRAALLAFAQQHGAVVLEDDYDGEFRYGARPLDALQTLDRHGCVFYLGTFSKSLFPALRIGYVAAPHWAHAALAAAKHAADWHCPLIVQDTLAAFIAEGHLARHVRRMRAEYGGRREVLLTQLERHFGGWLTPVPSSAGLHIAAHAARGVDVAALARAAKEQDIGIYTLAPYHANGRGKPGLVFGFGAIGDKDIAAGMQRLARVFSSA